TEGDILQQFLIESVVLTMLGGVIGIALGAVFVSLIYVAITSLSAIEWTFAFPLSAVLLSLVVSTLAGLVFGIYPARQAGRKNPIEALKYE
ncbi:FtsX-like permease family protein, partial [Candidatus Kaiserbacteria bacterium]|nr:FtsX-like permease family protein [Candidatus Kaiserbacteria bacterium]